MRNTWFSECARRKQAPAQPWNDEAAASQAQADDDGASYGVDPAALLARIDDVRRDARAQGFGTEEAVERQPALRVPLAQEVEPCLAAGGGRLRQQDPQPRLTRPQRRDGG